MNTVRFFTPAGASVAPRAFPKLSRTAIKVRAETEPMPTPEPVAQKDEVPLKFASEAVVEEGKKQMAAAPAFGNLMAFSGPAPELINGRLAMLGFVAAVFAELNSGVYE
eukprot:TRINITY_DN32722_c0_g3_i1.p3 TRINITY_DN32722_c0_g3~~TRINITY_DN32722_c0_g3_i1.p3  ORF type:complete len:109 (-),score=23.32 TRINITY_DN32722_c0_g3_i1:27-353(-)